jgi:hypothetical protein
LLVTDHFGASLNPAQTFEAESTKALAVKLSAAGYKVSVLYTGDMNDETSSGAQAFKKASQDMSARGIQLSRYVERD